MTKKVTWDLRQCGGPGQQVSRIRNGRKCLLLSPAPGTRGLGFHCSIDFAKLLWTRSQRYKNCTSGVPDFFVPNLFVLRGRRLSPYENVYGLSRGAVPKW